MSPDGELLVVAECKAAARGIDARSLQRIIAAAKEKEPPLDLLSPASRCPNPGLR
jgi:hypothetical protein